MFKALILSATVFVVSLSPAFADGMSDGVIRKIDLKNAKVTIKHGEIANLDMPPMSMVFTMKDSTLLDGLAKGDKVKFVAMEEGGKLFITQMQSTE